MNKQSDYTAPAAGERLTNLWSADAMAVKESLLSASGMAAV